MKVLYLMGEQRSGTTLVENLLAQINGVCTVGELRLLHGHYFKTGPGAQWNWNCSCGAPVKECEFWRQLSEASGDSFPSETVITKENPDQPAKNIERLYRTLHATHGPELIIDSSKHFKSAFILKRLLKHELEILVVRKNFLEVAASKYFHLKKADKKPNPLKLVIASFVRQQWLNMIVLLGIAKGVRYENLLDSEKRQQWLLDIADYFHLEIDELPSKMVNASRFHSIAGTPSRFEDSPIKPNIKIHRFLNDVLNSLTKGA